MAERFMLRVQKGCLVPADEHTKARLREKGLHFGDVLAAELRKPRNPQFHRWAHAFGQMVADNIEAFEGVSAHAVLKRLQLESNTGCDEIPLILNGMACAYRVPKSLSFSSMDEGEFHEVVRGMTQHVSKTYWKDLSPEQIEEMVPFVLEAA